MIGMLLPRCGLNETMLKRRLTIVYDFQNERRVFVKGQTETLCASVHVRMRF